MKEQLKQLREQVSPATVGVAGASVGRDAARGAGAGRDAAGAVAGTSPAGGGMMLGVARGGPGHRGRAAPTTPTARAPSAVPAAVEGDLQVRGPPNLCSRDKQTISLLVSLTQSL